MTTDDHATEIDAIVPKMTTPEPGVAGLDAPEPAVVGLDAPEPKVIVPETQAAPVSPAVVATPAVPPVPAVPTVLPAPAGGTPPVYPSADPARPTLRVGTIVWGLVITAIGIGIIASAAGAQVDVQLALIALLAGSGIALLAGSVLGSMRRRERR